MHACIANVLWQFNSWDRDPLLYTAEDGSLSVTPKTHQLRGNLIFNANFLGATQSVRRDHRDSPLTGSSSACQPF